MPQYGFFFFFHPAHYNRIFDKKAFLQTQLTAAPTLVDNDADAVDASSNTAQTLRTLVVVALELNRPSELLALRECVWAMNYRPVVRTEQYWLHTPIDVVLINLQIKHPRGKKAKAAQELLNNREVRFWISAPLQPAERNKLVWGFGEQFAFFYKSKDASSDERFAVHYPADEREIVDEFLFQLADVAIVPAKTDRARHMLFSQRAIVVDPRHGDKVPCRREDTCQPCWNWLTPENATCWQRASALGNIDRPRTCSHSLWYRW